MRAPLGAALLLLATALGVGCTCAADPGPTGNPRTLDEYLGDVRVAAQPGDRPQIPPWAGMGRRTYVPPAAQDLPAAVDVWDLPGDVGELAEPDERMSPGELGRIRDAALVLVREDPGNLLALWHATAARQVLGDAPGALGGYNQLVIMAPGLVPAHIQRSILLADLFRFEEALAELDYAEALQPSWDVYLNRGIALCFARRFEESEWDLWKAVEADPNDGNAYWDLAWVYAQRGDAARTVELLRWAARDRELFSRRFTRDKVRYDVFLSAVGGEPEFVAYAERLPVVAFVQEPDDRVLRDSSRRALPLPVDAPDGVEPGSGPR
jgi:hypothetical protein